MQDFIDRAVNDIINWGNEKIQYADCVAFYRAQTVAYINDGAYAVRHMFSCGSDTFAFIAEFDEISSHFEDWKIEFHYGEEKAFLKWYGKVFNNVLVEA